MTRRGTICTWQSGQLGCPLCASSYLLLFLSAPSQKVPLIAAVAIVVGNMVGTGILNSLGFQVAKLPSGFVVMMLWLLGGLISFCGAVNYAELTAAFQATGEKAEREVNRARKARDGE